MSGNDDVLARASNLVSSNIRDTDLALDLKWGGEGFLPRRSAHTYFDYVFTGQDIKVYIDGMSMDGACIPIIEFAFNIQQQKVPVYGFWSYTFDNVMRGTRIISGVIRIATTSTNYMRDRISEVASARANSARNLNPLRGLDKDQKDIEKYWTRNLDPDIGFNDNKHIFSAHPPFNLICSFNMQAISINDTPFNISEDLYKYYQDGPSTFMDFNERLTDTGEDGTMAYILENVELTSMETEFTPSGDVAAESYSFFARDIRTPKS